MQKMMMISCHQDRLRTNIGKLTRQNNAVCAQANAWILLRSTYAKGARKPRPEPSADADDYDGILHCQHGLAPGRRRLLPAGHSRGAKNAIFFECFPYVCAEPVLAK